MKNLPTYLVLLGVALCLAGGWMLYTAKVKDVECEQMLAKELAKRDSVIVLSAQREAAALAAVDSLGAITNDAETSIVYIDRRLERDLRAVPTASADSLKRIQLRRPGYRR
jgi:hypothetical protein